MIPLLIFIVKLIEYIFETIRVYAIGVDWPLIACICIAGETLLWAGIFKLTFFDSKIKWLSWQWFIRLSAYAAGSGCGTYISMYFLR